MKEELLSVGIDIGTSTTQLVFSKLIIKNIASNYSVPRIVISDKIIIYRSDIYFTPLRSPTEIDGSKIKELLENEYRKAGIDKDSIDTGAVIITGETARKENAKEVLAMLSGFAGDFVVATAGPDLESIISGKGAGAHIYSKENHCGVVNIDIGGGTSNLALFWCGEVQDTGCLDVGGRLVKVDQKTHEITYLSKTIENLIEKRRLPLSIGMIATRENLKPLIDAMVAALMQSVHLLPRDEDFSLFITKQDKSGEQSLSFRKEIDQKEEPAFICDVTMKDQYPATGISFSGGVADVIYHEGHYDDVFLYGDIGILLGEAIRESPLCKQRKLYQSMETIRATVVGAGTHTMEVSGSTITYTNEVFPIKNLPILSLSKKEVESSESIQKALQIKLSWYAVDGRNEQVAIAFEGIRSPTFRQVTEFAKGLIDGLQPLKSQSLPYVILVEHDMAKVLGQSMYSMLSYQKDIVCIDGVHVENGDYIDIGKPVAEGAVLPVVVKTLIFNKT